MTKNDAISGVPQSRRHLTRKQGAGKLGTVFQPSLPRMTVSHARRGTFGETKARRFRAGEIEPRAWKASPLTQQGIWTQKQKARDG